MTIVPFRSDQLTQVQQQPDPGPTGNAWIDLVAPAAELAKMIAATEFVPAEMRNKPAAVTACVLYGAEIGIGPMQALAKIDIVKGRPAPRAELARALALAAGHEVWVEDSTNTKVTVAGRRRGSDHVMKVTWTMDDTKRAGIMSGTYQKYPRQMLLAHTSAELVRQLCPDALGGITMFAEEADDVAAESSASPVMEPATKSTTTRRRAAAPSTAGEPAADAPPEPDVTGDGVTEAQIKRMAVGFNEISVKERSDRLSIIVSVIGRQVESSKDCTRDEAGRVIDALDRIKVGALELRYVDGCVLVAPAEPIEASATTDDEELPPLPFKDGEPE